MLLTIKQKLGITSCVFDAEIMTNMQAALTDLAITDIDPELAVVTDPFVVNAVATYCGYMHNLYHGNAELAERMKLAYDQQKATMITSSKYTEW